MKDEIAHAAPLLPKIMTQGGAVTTAGGGLWAWLGANYQQIGAIGVFVGAVVGIWGLWLTHKSNLRREEAQRSYHKEMLQAQREQWSEKGE